MRDATPKTNPAEPLGPGPLARGDWVEIDGIGHIENRIVPEP